MGDYEKVANMLVKLQGRVTALEAALTAIRERTGITVDENGDLWGWHHPGDGNNEPIFRLADDALKGETSEGT